MHSDGPVLADSGRVRGDDYSQNPAFWGLLRRSRLDIEQGTSKAAKPAIAELPRVEAMRHNAGLAACIDKDKWAYPSGLLNRRRESLLKRVDRLNPALHPSADDARIA